MSLMWAGPIDPEATTSTSRPGTRTRATRCGSTAPGAEPRVGCTMLLAIAPTESEALDVARRGMNGLIRRTHGVHRYDLSSSSEEESTRRWPAARDPRPHRRRDQGRRRDARADPRALRRDPRARPHRPLALQIPAGDMTFDEARRTLELFAPRSSRSSRRRRSRHRKTDDTAAASRRGARHGAARVLLDLRRDGYAAAGTIPCGPMFVQWEAPAEVTKPYPIVLVHGGGGQGTDWLGTPDGRPGWSTFLLREGYAVYVVDRPGHGRSPFHPDVLGPMGPFVLRARRRPPHEPRRGMAPRRDSISTRGGRAQAQRTTRASCSSRPVPVRSSPTRRRRTRWNARAVQPCSTRSGRRS